MDETTKKLRDQFAGQALSGLLANSIPDHLKALAPKDGVHRESHIAGLAYNYADHMLKERDKKEILPS